MRRYLIVSSETRTEHEKQCTFHHFDILEGENIDEVIRFFLTKRPRVDHYTYLPEDEVYSIYYAMINKPSERLLAKFLENTK